MVLSIFLPVTQARQDIFGEDSRSHVCDDGDSL